MKKRTRQRVYRIVTLLVTIIIIDQILGLGARQALPRYSSIRSSMMGLAPSRTQRFISHPYAAFCLNPDHPAVNAHGYRGPLVPLDKGTAKRIVCLGGSTTFGFYVSADESYPAQLERILDESAEAEVMNCGCPQATSAEMLGMFQHRWSYWKPDLVIVNMGGNDARMIRADYQPDYTHARHGMNDITQVPRGFGWLMRSNLVALPVIWMAYGDIARGYTFSHVRPRADFWEKKEYPAFKNNVERIILECRRIGADVVLMPFHYRPEGFSEQLQSHIKRHEQELRELADKYQLKFAPLPSSLLDEKDWHDACHLTASGCKKKAQYLASFCQ